MGHKVPSRSLSVGRSAKPGFDIGTLGSTRKPLSWPLLKTPNVLPNLPMFKGQHWELVTTRHLWSLRWQPQCPNVKGPLRPHEAPTVPFPPLLIGDPMQFKPNTQPLRGDLQGPPAPVGNGPAQADVL